MYRHVDILILPMAFTKRCDDVKIMSLMIILSNTMDISIENIFSSHMVHAMIVLMLSNCSI